jgi:hypothetical protein
VVPQFEHFVMLPADFDESASDWLLSKEEGDDERSVVPLFELPYGISENELGVGRFNNKVFS